MIYAVVLPILLLAAPWLLIRYVFSTQYTKKLAYKTYALYLWLAAALWELGIWLPDVGISPATDTFTMHTLGGMAATSLFVYAVKAYRIRFASWWQTWVGLYLFVSGLGVLNELFEFFLSGLHVKGVVGGDEWWDLTANTLGAFVAYIILTLLRRT